MELGVHSYGSYNWNIHITFSNDELEEYIKKNGCKSNNIIDYLTKLLSENKDIDNYKYGFTELTNGVKILMIYEVQSCQYYSGEIHTDIPIWENKEIILFSKNRNDV